MNVELLEEKLHKKTKAYCSSSLHWIYDKYAKTFKKFNLKNIIFLLLKMRVNQFLQILIKKILELGEILEHSSLHLLKNINVWSDGGIITTNKKKYYDKLKLLRNHGLVDRDTVKINGYNSRLDTFQL